MKRNSVAITFDDGYATFDRSDANPEIRLLATFFISGRGFEASLWWKAEVTPDGAGRWLR
jgi:hypothetical protein